MDGFVETRLDTGAAYGTVGGPMFQTDVVVFGSGHEFRSANWDEGKGRWELGDAGVTQDQLETLQAFFRARRGKAVGFRYKDYNDYQAVDEPLAPDGTPTLQLTKTYTSASVDQVRTITKPVSGTVTMEKNSASFTSFSVDTATGIVTLTAASTASITAITQAHPASVTATGHGFSTGDVIYLTGIGGMVELNDAAYTITVVDANTFTLDGVDSTTFTAYTSSGSAEKYVQPTDTLTWSGEFDVPVRFDTDEFRARFDAADPDTGTAVYFLASLPIVEVRV